MKNLLLVLSVFITFSFLVKNEIIASTQSPKPNIVFILTDDQQYGLMGCTGNDIVQTPHIDALAADGVLFTNLLVTRAIQYKISSISGQVIKSGKTFNSSIDVSQLPQGVYTIGVFINEYYSQKRFIKK